MKKEFALFLAAVIWLSVCCTPGLAAADLPNVALNKPVTATSEWGGAYVMKAVNDGNMNTAWSSGSSLLNPRTPEGYQWIMIDLEARYEISSMIAYSRGDVNFASERMGWIYQVAESADFSDAVTIGEKNAPGSPGVGYEVTLKKPVIARYVRVACAAYFVIAEIEVYGTPAPEKAKGEYDDIEAEGTLYNASQLAYCLKLMEGADSSNFGVGNLLTRGEAAEIAARLTKQGNLEPCATVYSDVPEDHSKSGYISWCTQTGIVSLGGSYRPDDYITGIEFVTMLLRLNGYYALAEGSYPEGVLDAAQRCKLLKNVDIAIEQPLNKSRALLLIYNMLQAEILRTTQLANGRAVYAEGEFYLKEVFGYVMKYGIVSANGVSDLVEPQRGSTAKVTVGGEIYSDQSGKMAGYLGERVYYLLDEENEEIFYAWRNSKLGTRQTIQCADIVSSKESGLRYYDEETQKEQSVSFTSKVYFIKNGVASGNYRLENLKRVNGKLVLIDNDNDGSIDVVKLYEPKVLVVDYIGVTDDRVSIGGKNGESFDVSGYRHLAVLKNGFTMDYTDISNGQLIYAYVSDDEQYVELEVSQEILQGNVDAFSDSEVTVDGKTVSFSEYYMNNKSLTDPIRVGTDSEFLLDENGKIVWVINDSLVSGTESLGVICAISDLEKLSGPRFKIYNQSGEFLTLACAETVKVDGIKRSSDGMIALGESYFVGKLAAYRLNTSGFITYLDTEYYNSAKEEYSTLQVQTKWTLPSGCYRNASGFYQNKTMVFPVYQDFPVFTIPVDSQEGKIVTDEKFRSRFSYRMINNLFPSTSDTQSSGSFVFYGEEDDDSPRLAVRRYTINTVSGVNSMSNYTSNNTLIVNSVNICLDRQGEQTYKIEGINAAGGQKIRLVVSADLTSVLDSYRIYIAKQNGQSTAGIGFTGLNYISSTTSTALQNYASPISDLNPGDILRYETADNSITALERIYNVKDDISVHYNGHLLNTGDNYGVIPRAGYRAYCGAVGKIQNGIFELQFSSTSYEGFNYLNSKVKNFVLVENNKVESQEINLLPMYAEVGDRAFVVSLSGNASYLVIYRE